MEKKNHLLAIPFLAFKNHLERHSGHGLSKTPVTFGTEVAKPSTVATATAQSKCGETENSPNLFLPLPLPSKPQVSPPQG